MTIAAGLLLAVFSTDPQVCDDEKYVPHDVVVCDDGSTLYDRDGRTGDINYRCIREGCSMFEEDCWDFRLDHCYDHDVSNGQCTLAEETCTTKGGCIWLWAWCEGTLHCGPGGVNSEWCVCITE